MSGSAVQAVEPVGLPLDKPTSVTDNCYTADCHAQIAEYPVIHGPVAQGKCDACHQYDQPAEHTFTLLESGQALCTGCHTVELRDYVHEPMREGNCLGCHAAHGSEHKMLLASDPTRGLCTECHKEDPFSQKKYQHGPVAAGACILCHEAHSAWRPKLLVEDRDHLCQMCHDDMADESNPMMRHVHEPVKGDCSVCHDPHATDHPFQLLQNSPDLCYSCHEEMKEQMTQATVVHGALNEEGGCRSCHTAHACPRWTCACPVMTNRSTRATVAC
ncbi:MAG: cytochrome c3 family protein [Planctomycetota bacterium]